MSRLREGHELAVTPGGDAVTETSSRASGSDCEICYHGCNPRQLSQILQRGLLPNKSKQDIVAVWSSPHIHTAVGYPMALIGGQAVTARGPALRVILKLEVPRSSIIRRVAGRRNRAGLPVNYQWPLRRDGINVLSIHMWCYEGHAAPEEAMAMLNIAKGKKERALMRDADELCSVIPADDRDRQEIDLEAATPAPARIPPAPARPRGSVGAALRKLRMKLKRQRQWVRRHRERIAAMSLPQPPAASSSQAEQ